MSSETGGHKIEMARRILLRWARLQGHDKCWHHPEILTELCDLFDIDYEKHPPQLPPREEFRNGCIRYEGELYEPQNLNGVPPCVTSRS